MTELHRSDWFLRAYRHLPHAALNRAARAVASLERPRPLVDAAVRAWVRRDGIDLDDFEQRRFRSLEDFFLRRLREGARPLAASALLFPADGAVVGAGTLSADTMLQVKGKTLSVDRVVHGRAPLDPWDLTSLRRWVTVFLRPRGYHYVHAPCDAVLRAVRWIPGRFFPQNEDALRVINGIYEQNERASLLFDTAFGPLLLVLVGASLIGGIELAGIDRARWARVGSPLQVTRAVGRGEELGHFTFGSTVVTLLPDVPGVLPEQGREIRMGEAMVG